MKKTINLILFLLLSVFSIAQEQKELDFELQRENYSYVGDEYYDTFKSIDYSYLQYVDIYKGKSTDEQVKASIIFNNQMPLFDKLNTKDKDEVLFLVDIITNDSSAYRYRALALFAYIFKDKYPAPLSIRFAIDLKASLNEMYLPMKEDIIADANGEFTYDQGLANLTEIALLQVKEGDDYYYVWEESLAYVLYIIKKEGYLKD